MPYLQHFVFEETTELLRFMFTDAERWAFSSATRQGPVSSNKQVADNWV